MRPTKHDTFFEIAMALSKQSTCHRRQVGCVMINRHQHIVASGYNGVAAGLIHCIDSPCRGIEFASGKGLEVCEAIHAEQNALMQCRDIFDISTVFVTTPPCVHCVKMLMNTSAKKIYTKGDYAHKAQSKHLWCKAGRAWVDL